MKPTDSETRELMTFWAVLDADDRARLIGEAKRLVERATFIGGPFDGYPVPVEDRDSALDDQVHALEYGPERVAVYQFNHEGRFQFVEVRPNDKGGEQ